MLPHVACPDDARRPVDEDLPQVGYLGTPSLGVTHPVGPKVPDEDNEVGAGRRSPATPPSIAWRWADEATPNLAVAEPTGPFPKLTSATATMTAIMMRAASTATLLSPALWAVIPITRGGRRTP